MITKFSWMGSLPHFLTHGASRARAPLIKTRTESGKCFCIRVFFLSIKRRLIVMSKNLKYRERERQTKQREIRATGQRSSTRKGARAIEKKQKETFSVGGTI